MNNDYDKYFPEPKDKADKDEPRTRVQAMVKESLHEYATQVLDKTGWTWTEFLEGLIAKHKDDTQKKNKTG